MQNDPWPGQRQVRVTPFQQLFGNIAIISNSFQFFSVFLRNCRECLVVSACGQFRTRDCTGITCYLFCPSQPSLETSTSFWFHCLSLDYPQFRGILHWLSELIDKPFLEKSIFELIFIEQMDLAGLNRMNLNRWAEVFDFTCSSQSSNWRLLDVENRLEDHLTEQELDHCVKSVYIFPQLSYSNQSFFLIGCLDTSIYTQLPNDIRPECFSCSF